MSRSASLAVLAAALSVAPSAALHATPAAVRSGPVAAPSLRAPAPWHAAPSAIAFGVASAPLPAIRAAAGLPADVPSVDWKILAGLDYVNGTATDTLKALEGKLVRIPGFVVPLDDFEEEGAEFLLVPYYGACVHTPPPPPNQIVYVQMKGNEKVKLALFDAVWMHGALEIASVESPYGTVGFTLEGVKMEPYSSR